MTPRQTTHDSQPRPEDGPPRKGGRLAVVTAVAGTVFIACGAFWLSFTALADLARKSGIQTGQAWAWPLIVDGIIVVATVAVVALARTRSAWYPWVLLACGAVVSVTANALHAIVSADTDVPGVLAACVAAVPPLVLLAITHLTVILTRPARPVTWGGHHDEAPETDHPHETASAPEQIAVLPATRTGLTPATTDDPRPHDDNDARDDEGPSRPTVSVPSAPEEPVSEVVAGEAGVRDGLPRGAAREVAQTLHAAGWSNTRIAELLGVHKSTVGRWGPQPPDVLVGAGTADAPENNESDTPEPVQGAAKEPTP